ncbi:carbohydrate-binding module family 13 protein [Schizopora paradoxa]|uniref:Carbohydrate-binding module family 13 protein n=1 Tax=Schizopora paradoxa TaxID=27342 RepID=A0A0H2RFY3_9AGAM|nr:carbohydrate-binding module family 13 protein [Schizopora paradoxa]
MFSRTNLIAHALVLLGASSVYAGNTPASLSPVLIEPGNNAGFCLTAASNSNGAPVQIQPCTGADSQRWSFTGGQIKIFNNAMCLNAPNGATSSGTKLQISSCGNASKWNYDIWTTRILLANQNQCLDLTGGNMNSGNQVQIWECSWGNSNQIWNTGYYHSQLPDKSENGQTGTNNCGTGSSQSSMCQTAWINDVDDFCLWAPPSVGAIGNTEREEVAWCTKSGRGTRTIPNGALQGVHFVKTPDYVQVTGVGDFTKINIPKGDDGGELDPHGADGNGNPIGGLVYGNSFGSGLQYHEWTNFMSDSEFCFRACTGPNAARNCQHIYDEMGCYWNMPANYDAGVFESCKGDDDLPMGVYGTSTWHQGVSPTPAAHPVAKSSDCRTLPTVSVSPAKAKRDGFFTIISIYYCCFDN